MNGTLTLDRAGRIVLPKMVRDEMQLRPGESLEFDSSDERIVLRPAQGKGRMRKIHGVWVFDAGAAMDADLPKKTLNKIRRERDRKSLGLHK
jgi:AbrB family looped-hinge helix DNA binding protein